MIGLCLPLKSLALTQWEGLNITSAVIVDGELYAIGPDGFYRYGGSDDVKWTIKGPQLDMGTGQVKSLRSGSLQGEVYGDVQIETQADEGQPKAYTVKCNNQDGRQSGATVNFGANQRGVTWSFKLSGKTDFSLDSIELQAILSQRRR